MRLGQLSRQVNVSQKEIVSFLKKERGIELKVHPNVKVEDEFVELITDEFEVKTPDEAKTEEPEVAETKSETKEEVISEAVDAAQTEEAMETSVAEIKEYLPGEEFIRPSGPIEKVETEIPKLEGIKVVGKIDLPEFHKQEPAPDKSPEDENGEAIATSETIETESPAVELPNATPLFKRPNRKKKKETEKPKRAKKVVSEDEKKKKALAKEEAKRKAYKKAKKEEARKKHLELVKGYQKPQKQKKQTVKAKQKIAEAKKPIESAPKNQPKTIFGKIWRWMNTE